MRALAGPSFNRASSAFVGISGGAQPASRSNEFAAISFCEIKDRGFTEWFPGFARLSSQFLDSIPPINEECTVSPIRTDERGLLSTPVDPVYGPQLDPARLEKISNIPTPNAIEIRSVLGTSQLRFGSISRFQTKDRKSTRLEQLRAA